MEPLACGLPKATICVECDMAKRLHQFYVSGDGGGFFLFCHQIVQDYLLVPLDVSAGCCDFGAASGVATARNEA